MRFTLKDFQEEAVKQLLSKLTKAQLLISHDQGPVSLSLTATTGAGKTVMASAVIESLFFGSDKYGFDADPNAVVLWVTDDPSLNEQTRWRFQESSELVDLPRLQIINEGFDQETFAPQMVYFLNRQKLSSSTNYVKAGDKRNYTLWQTIQNTIESSERNLYMILDEAHRGLGGNPSARDDSDRQTVYSQLIDGAEGRSPMPIVLGISATIERFTTAMQSSDRTMVGNIAVDPRDVQASGLLKDTITLLIPDERGSFDAALLKEACSALRESQRYWQQYCEEQELKTVVKPLMVLQVPNLVSDDELFALCEQLMGNLPELDPHESFAHVLGDRESVILGGGKYLLRHVSPQDVQETVSVTVLFAKEAVSTGWDCPRAEVLFSLRPGQDKTYIAQLIGRMVRTPLARRIEGNDILSSVACFLPRFNKATTYEVAKYLTGDLAFDDSISQMPDRKVLTAPVVLEWDESLGQEVIDAFESLPTLLVPRAVGNQVERLLDFAGKLALFDVDLEADTEARDLIVRVIESQRVLYEDKFNAALKEVFTAHTTITTASREDGGITQAASSIVADKAIIEEGFAAVCRAISKEAAIEYLKHIVVTKPELDYLDARAEVAAVGLVPEMLEELAAQCSRFADELYSRNRDAIYGLDDESRAAIDDVRSRAAVPQETIIDRPQNLMVNSCVLFGETPEDLPEFPKHVLSLPDSHEAPMSLNDLEAAVVMSEIAKPDTVAWYRNPSGASKSAVQIPWQEGNKWRSMQPDFVFFSKMADSSVKPSIIDPHGSFLGDALGKLRGFAAYAEQYEDKFKRLESVNTIDGTNVYLDLKDADVREAIMNDEHNVVVDIYRELGNPYV